MKLNFPEYRLQIKSEKSKNYVFDLVRKKYVVLTPEEWVRQHLLHHLIDLGYPQSLISIERQLPSSKRRYDLVVYDRNGELLLIAECKSAMVPINEQTIEQINAYLMQLPAPYALLTNGLNHYFLGREIRGVLNYQQIPPFATISG
ncbi:MAG: type I restriction enzyme HsdR N-terminal domain-containing protein [Bacteroidia bacterium]